MILLKTESKAKVRGVFVNGIYYFVLYMLSFHLCSAFFFICTLFLLYGLLKLPISPASNPLYAEVCSYILPSYHTSGVCQLCPSTWISAEHLVIADDQLVISPLPVSQRCSECQHVSHLGHNMFPVIVKYLLVFLT